MRVRHRIPSIFNLSMVDVLCCALGCVILIWLINLRDSKENQDEARKHEAEANSLLESQKTKIDELTARLQVAGARADSLQARLRMTGRQLDTARGGAADLTRQLAEARGRIDALQAVADTVPGLRDDLKKTQGLYAAAQAAIAGLNGDLSSAQADATKTGTDLAGANKQVQALKANLDDVNRELALLRPYKEKYLADEDKLLKMTNDLAEARRTADAAQADTTKARNEASRFKAQADARFEGIALTGKRVVFLVDMSGSMDYVDDNTRAPEKWLGVRTAVVKIMKSLEPGLEKFQLIAFSDKTHFPLGSEGQWLDYDPKTSPDLVFKTLAGITPEGGTNMYSAMQSAFLMRERGLDTIYFCSDGLPNLGEGVTAQEIKTLTEDERSAKLSVYIRNKLKSDWNREIAGQSRVHIHTIGFFYESPDVGAFLWAMARENEGGFVGMSKP